MSHLTFLRVVVVARSTVIHYDGGSAAPVAIFRVTGRGWHHLVVPTATSLSRNRGLEAMCQAQKGTQSGSCTGMDSIIEQRAQKVSLTASSHHRKSTFRYVEQPNEED